MAYTTTKKTTLGQLQYSAQQLKGYIDAQIAALPSDQFLDQAHTTFVYNFAWSNATYPGSTNPNLEGKSVLVLAVKGQGDDIAYSFLDLSLLIDINKIDKVTSATANNLPKFVSGGTLADSGVAVANVLTTADVASDAEVEEAIEDALSDDEEEEQQGGGGGE